MQVLSRLTSPNQAYTIAYRADQPGLVSEPASLLPGPSDGLTWAAAGLPDPLPELLSNAAEGDLSPLYLLALDKSGSPGGRRGLVELDGIEAPYPQLHDMVDEAFMALRLAVSEALSWDLMASLENAFVPITIPLPPGLAEDWLLTGRAFTFITAPLDAGWLAVVREDYGQETFWRVYGRARFQDGSQGRPLNSRPWVFNPQNAPEISLYEIGGATASSVPAGFWIDLTDLAAAFGWERLPALYNWRSYFLGTRLNEFVMRDNTDWRSAMLELYPPEVLVTPTMIIPPTRTPTPTIRWWRTPTPSSTPMPPPTLTPSPRP
jgi:TolB protein